MKIGKRIQAFRQAKRLSISELARRQGISKGHISLIENEKFSPGILTLIRITEGLDVGVQKLLTLTSVEILLHDPFVGAIRAFLPCLNARQRELLLRTLEAAPKIRRPL